MALLVCITAISRQSLWNDEALTAVKAMQPTLGGWWQEMRAEKASDLQMPLYMIYLWGFVKIFGASEWALRAANIPWFVTGIAVFMKALRGRGKIALAIVALICPYAWYYLDEARPYAMQLGASLMIFAALHRFSQDEAMPLKHERAWMGLFCFGLVSLSGSSMLGMIWAGAACLSVLVLLPIAGIAKLLRSHLLICVMTSGLLAALAGYYIWTVKEGARASDVGRTDARNLVFILYELLGFGGLGPGRLEIREEGLKAFVPFVARLVIYGALVSDLLILGGWRIYKTQKPRKLAGLMLVILLPMAAILAAGYLKEFRVLGRHFTPVMPVVLFALWIGLQRRWARAHWASKPLACGFVILSLLSCLSFRFAPRHERDDYRDAAHDAKAALQAGEGGVWWNAGWEGGVYYHVPLTDKPDKHQQQAFWLMNPTPAMLSNLSPPALVITSKPDAYDSFGAVGQYLVRAGYFKVATLPAFTIWQRKAESPATPRIVQEFY